MTAPRRHVHGDQPVLHAGLPVSEARAAAILVHGRGGAAAEMIRLSRELDVSGVHFMAPQASGHTWYPYSFLSETERNQPGLDSGLRRLAELISELETAGLEADRVLLLGFSQGACLSLEFVARNARRYGGVVGWSGGLIGPEGTERNYPGTLDGTPVFLGCSDIDPHIPLERVKESTRALSALDASVDERIYPGMGHTVNPEEFEIARSMLQRLAEAP